MAEEWEEGKVWRGRREEGEGESGGRKKCNEAKVK